MSIDTRARRAADAVRASVRGVDPMVQLAELKREDTVRRRTGLAVAAVIVVMAVAAGGWYASGGRLASRDLTPTHQTRTPPEVKIARAFLSAYNSYQADRAAGYLTDRAIAASWGSPAAFRQRVAWNRAAGYREIVRGCEKQADSGSGLRVRCRFDFHGLRSDELGLGPYGDNYWDFSIADGRIALTGNELAFESNGFSTQMWEPFARWVSAKHPTDVEVMYVDSSQTLQRQTDAATRLWDERTRDYVSRVMRTWQEPKGTAYIARAEAICTAAHQRVIYEPGTDVYTKAWGRILGEALAGLRLVEPPLSVRSQFERAYQRMDRLAEAMRTGDRIPIDALHKVESSALGLQECTFHGPR